MTGAWCWVFADEQVRCGILAEIRAQPMAGEQQTQGSNPGVLGSELVAEDQTEGPGRAQPSAWGIH
jgi:hypothetical protein